MAHASKTARSRVVRAIVSAIATALLLSATSCASPDRMPARYPSSRASVSPDASQTPTDAMTPAEAPVAPAPSASTPAATSAASAPDGPTNTPATSTPTSGKATSTTPSAAKSTKATTAPFALHPNGGVGGFATGASEASVTAWLNQRFGKPDRVTSGVWCEIFEESPYSATYHYGKLDVTFFAKAGQRSTTAPRTLAGWTYHLPQPANSAVILPDGLPASPTYAQLKKSFPKGAFEDTEIFDPMFTLPDGVVLIGAPQPTTVYDASRPIFCD